MKSLTYPLWIALTLYAGIIFGQQNQSNSMTNQAMVTTFLEGFNDSSKIQASVALLADDYQFQNPMIKLHSKAEFIELAQQIGAVLTGVELLQVAENRDWVAAIYIFKSAIPGLESNLATEWFRLENGLIKESKLIYDASEWRKVYAQMNK